MEPDQPPAVSGAGPQAGAVLASAALFAGLPPPERALLVGALMPCRFEAGQVVVTEGDPGDAMYIIAAGAAAVVSHDLAGQERVLAEYGPGQHFGEMALITGAPRSATVRATGALETLVLTRAAFERVRQECPALVAVLQGQVDLLALDGFLQKASPFAHLDAATIRKLAGQLRSERHPAGGVVFLEGDPGDRLLLVRSGRVELTRAGRRLQVMEAGDCFGEVALLTAEPRTATVRALDDTELLALSKADFAAVVEGSEALQRQFREFTRIRVGAALAERVAAVRDPLSTLMPDLAGHRRRRYWMLLVVGLALFGGLSLVAARAGSGLPVYAAIISGSFVGPVVYVVYLAESHLLPERKRDVVIAFLLAAGLGIPLAIYIEILVGARSGALGGSMLVALIEEPAKLVGVAWLMRRTTARFQMDGLVYGAAAGMGFAAFETVMYGFYRINSVETLLATLWVRALLSPLGHGTWTAIICGAIWRHKAAARRDARVVLAFATAVVLHTLWDWRPVQGILPLVWFVLIGGVGLVVLREMLDAATREAAQAVVALNPEVSGGRAGGVEAACHVCGQVAPPGTHYCARCGAVLRGRIAGT